MSYDLFFNNVFENGLPENVRKLEAEQIEELTEITVKLLNKRYAKAKQILRGVHPKSHGCVDATFEVLPGIDRTLRVGLFARPRLYNAVIRYSNAAVLVEPDLKGGANGSRGMAIKVCGVDGKVLLGDKGSSSQDFLMINTPSFAFANTGDYLRLNQILLNKGDDMAKLFFAPLQAAQTNPPTDPKELAELARIGRSFGVLQKILKTPVANPLEVAYFGGAPYLFGKGRCMHFSAVPRGELTG